MLPEPEIVPQLLASKSFTDLSDAGSPRRRRLSHTLSCPTEWRIALILRTDIRVHPLISLLQKNYCVTWNVRVYANFVSNLFAYLISIVSP